MFRGAGLLAVAASLCEAQATRVPCASRYAVHRAAARGGRSRQWDGRSVNRRSLERCRGLLALGSDDDGCYVRRIHGGVEKFRAGQLGKVNEFISNLLHLSADLLAAFHPQLDDLTGIPLQNANDGIAGLEINFGLSEQTGANKSEGKDSQE
jgi:hypothetical protein